MAGFVSPTEKQTLINLFLEVAGGQTAHTAYQFLQATSWNLEEAIQLFYAGSDHAGAAHEPELSRAPAPAPAPVTVGNSGDNLAELYRLPFGLTYEGTFEEAKEAARVQNRWLLVNVQSTMEFSSHLLNRDTWSNEVVSQTIKRNYFIFWQVYDDKEEGKKVCTYYKLVVDSIINLPVIMVIDPVTGERLSSWRGMVQPETLLENLVRFIDGSPMDYHLNLSQKRRSHQLQTVNQEEEGICNWMEGVKHIDDISEAEESGMGAYPYPPLAEEPEGGDRNLVCRVGVRLPDGRRLQRNFFRSDPVQLLWSFVYSQLQKEAKTQQFRLTQAIPGSSKSLDYNTELSFEASGFANSMISVAWE